ncbi:MAG: NUDIX domain-containing protein [Anaerolineae bacterium]|nr:NUDIX domain-containing protein [Anaerolineae bacterium]
MTENHRYRVVPRTLTLLRHGERWLLIRRAADRELWPGLYNGIGGHVEEGEGVLASAQRELLEEAGLTAGDLRLVGVIHASEGSRGVVVFVFTGVATSEEVVAGAEGAPLWVTLSEALDLDLMPDLRLILPRLLAMRPDDPPFLARSTLDAAGRPSIVFE